MKSIGLTRFGVLLRSLSLSLLLLYADVFVYFFAILNQKTTLGVDHLGQIIFEVLSKARIPLKFWGRLSG